MSCETCKKVKDKPMTYTKCKQCGDWRKMSEGEIKLAKTPFSFKGDGQPRRSP